MKIRSYFNKLKSILGLSWSLAKANFKVKNEGSYLGIFWYLLEPLALFLIILFIKGVAFSNSKIEFYPIYLLFGIIISNLFSGVVGSSINTISNNSGFIKSIKINYESLVLSNVFQDLISHMFEVVIIIIFIIYFKISLLGIIFYFIFLIFFTLFLIGASFIFSTIGAYVSDFGNIWKFISQLLFFMTPTFYVINKSDPHYLVNLFNPLYYFLDISREIVIYERFPELWMILIGIVFSFSFFIIGIFVFEKNKHKFAELV